MNLRWAIDEELRLMAFEGAERFSPIEVCNRLGSAEYEAVTEYLLKLDNDKLIAKWEVECPEGHSDFTVRHPDDISPEPHYCRLCEDEEPYIPDPDRVWLVFDFNPEYVAALKKNLALQRKKPPLLRTPMSLSANRL